MATNKKFRFGPLALTTTLTTDLLSPPQSTGGVNAGASPMYVLLRRVAVVNTGSATRTFSLWLGASGSNTGGKEIIGSGMPVTGHSTFTWAGEMRIDSGEFMVGGASGSGLTIEGEGEIGVAG
jgi:hypothetical protein